jgi:hypothetical protein
MQVRRTFIHRPSIAKWRTLAGVKVGLQIPRQRREAEAVIPANETVCGGRPNPLGARPDSGDDTPILIQQANAAPYGVFTP